MDRDDRDDRVPELHGEEPGFTDDDIELAWRAFAEVAEADILPRLHERYRQQFGRRADADTDKIDNV